MKKIKMISKIICSVSLIITPLAALAGSTGVESTSTSSQPSVNQSATNSSSSNTTGQALSYIASATEFGVAAMNWPQCPHNGSACATAALFTVMAIQSLQQGNEHGNVAGASGYTADLTNAYDTGNYDSANNIKTAAVGNEYLKKAQSSLRNMQSNGYINSTGTKVTSPDGKTYNVSDMTSPSAMQAAGIPKAAIDAAMATYAKIEKKAMDKLKIGAQTAANGFEEGSSGGGIASGVDSQEGAMPVAGVGARGLGTGSLASRDPSSLAAGMSKNYNGEPIGVAADSIFLMMTRRYKVKESQDSFFGANDLLPKK